jgi:peptide deformylase
MIVPIVTVNDPNSSILRANAQLVRNPELVKEIVENLFDTLANSKGVGLSAPQIGISLRIFVVSYEGWKQAFVNPEIIDASKEKVSLPEGCLSIPGVEVSVPRAKTILMDYFDEYGNAFRKRFFRTMKARILQHEFDHLVGKLITDYK